MPPEVRPPELPHAVHRALLPHWKSDTAARIITVITLVFVISAIMISYTYKGDAVVPVLSRDESGGRTILDLHVGTGELSENTSLDATRAAKQNLFRQSDGSTISISDIGVVRHAGSSTGPLSVLIASPVPPSYETPIVVWGDGKRIAWKSPVDDTVQAFALTARGTYTPLRFIPGEGVTSISFTEDGSELLMAKTVMGKTEIMVVPLSEGEPRTVGTYEGFITLLPLP